MNIYARNSATTGGAVDIEVYGDDGFSLGGIVALPPARHPGDFRGIYVTQSGLVSDYLSNPPLAGRLVSTWGTFPRQTENMQQQQDDRVIQFVADFDYDQDYGKDVRGDGKWRYRGNYGGWPSGYTRAIYLRGECGRRLETGSGIAQINFASTCIEGTTSRGSMSFVTQAKGYNSAGNRDYGLDWMRVVLDPVNNDRLAVMINDRSLGVYLNSGYELKL
jgi:hypothetical protein